MTVIESVSPGYKPFVDYITDLSSVRPNLREHYSQNEIGQRLLIPVGRDRYDVFFSVDLAELGNEKEQDLIAVARSIPKTYIEERAPHQVENEFYIFTVGKFKVKFRYGGGKRLNDNNFRYMWYFSKKMGDLQIMYRIRKMLARIWEKRAAGIERSCARKHITPYKNTAKIITAFRDAAAALEKYSQGIVYKSESKQPEKESKPDDLILLAEKHILDEIKALFPKVYEPVRTFFSIEYPALNKPPPDPI